MSGFGQLSIKAILMLILTILLICSLWNMGETAHIDFVGDYIIKNELCLFIPSYGACKGRFKAFGYDYRSNRCILFFYSGCGGNANRFEDENTCRTYCRHYDEEEEGTAPNYDYTSSTDYYHVTDEGNEDGDEDEYDEYNSPDRASLPRTS